MKKRLFLPLSAIIVLFLFACKSKDSQGASANATAEILKHETRTFVKRHCVNDDQCADFNIIYLNVSSNNAALAEAVNKAIQARTIAGLDGNKNLPVEVALDSAGIKFIDQFVQLKRDIPDQTQGQEIQLTSNVPLNNPKVMTVRLDFFFSTGGAHPNSASAVMSFDLQNGGRELTAGDLLKDTNAVLPLLEKAYKQAKQLQETDDIGQLLLTENKKLPLPVNVGIVPEGILFAYNDYEVAPHAVGPTDIVLTWEQLGPLADKSRWIQ
jgi:hypothetical protein